jgi:hypothetical protein
LNEDIEITRVTRDSVTLPLAKVEVELLGRKVPMVVAVVDQMSNELQIGEDYP